MSNVFAKIEEKELLISLKDKANMILEYEVIVRFIKKILRKIRKNENVRESFKY